MGCGVVKKYICVFLSFILTAISLTGCNPSKTASTPPTGDTAFLGDELTPLKGGPDFSGDTVNTSIYGDILKIDDITPGLNTYTMKTTMYSLTEQKILGQTPFLPEGDWNTGSIDGGFYAAALDRCELILFNNACQETMRKKPADTGNLWAFAAVSPDKKYLLYGNAQTAEIHVYTLSDGSQKRVGIFSGYIEVAGFTNGCFYLRTGEGALIKVDPEKDRSEVVLVDIRLNVLSPYYSLGKTDDNFMLKTPDPSPLQYTEMTSIDEVPIATGEPGFITSASEIDSDLLRVYRVKDAEMFTIKVPYTVQQVYFDDERMVITAKDMESGQIKLYLHDAQSEKAAPILLYDTDKAPSNDKSPNLSESNPADSESEVPSAARVCIKGVPVIAQMPDYPTGCESVSAVMALQFAGKDMSVDAFIDDYLEKSSDFYKEDGLPYGPNPYEVFIGSPRSSRSFGCMAPVIEKALVKVYSSDQFITNTTGKTMEELCQTYIDKGIPVMVWVSIEMIEPYYTSCWYLPNGEKYTWLANEHCMLLIGYDQDNYYFNDPYTGQEVKYSKSLSQKRYDAFGKQSLVINK